MEKTITPSKGPKVFLYFRGALGDSILFLPVVTAFFKTHPGGELTLACPVEVFRVLLPLTLSGDGEERVFKPFISGLKLIHHAEARFRFFFGENESGEWPPELVAFLRDFDQRIWVVKDIGGRLARELARLKLHGTSFIHPPFPDVGESVRDHHRGLIQRVGWKLENDNLQRIKTRHSPKSKVLIHPGSGSAAKNWPLTNYLKLARGLTPMVVSFLFGPADVSLLEECRSQWLGNGIYSELSLSSVVQLLRSHDVYVGNDSGVSHLAALLGIRSLVIAGRNGVGFWDPAPEGVTILWTDDPAKGPEVDEALFLVFKLSRD